MEAKVLSAVVQDRESFERIKDYVKPSDLSDQGQIVWDYISNYYERDDQATFVDLDIIRSAIEREYPKNSEILIRAVDNIADTSSVNVEREFLELKLIRLRQDLSHAFQAGDGAQIDELLAEYDKYSNDIASLDDVDRDHVYISEPIDSLLKTVHPDNLIRVYPRILNERLGGGVPPGTHILVYARPESGKTAFAINMAAGFANKDRRVLYIANEEPWNMMLLRIISRLSGMTRQEITVHPDEAMGRARSKGYDNIVLAYLSPGTMSDIKRLATKYEPDVILIDQLHNLQSKVQNKVERLESQAKQARDLGGQTGAVVVSMTQADESAEGKAVLEMGDVYFSNTGIQGHVDVMMGIGKDDEMDRMDRRMVSLCKNKWTGDHNPFYIHINRYLSKVTSV